MISRPSIFHNIVLRDLFVGHNEYDECGQRVRSCFPHPPINHLWELFFSFSSGLMISCCFVTYSRRYRENPSP